MPLKHWTYPASDQKIPSCSLDVILKGVDSARKKRKDKLFNHFLHFISSFIATVGYAGILKFVMHK